MVQPVGSYGNLSTSFAIEPMTSSTSPGIKTNPSSDYLGLALILHNAYTLKQATQEFIYSFDPHRFYISVQDLKNSKGGMLSIKV